MREKNLMDSFNKLAVNCAISSINQFVKALNEVKGYHPREKVNYDLVELEQVTHIKESEDKKIKEIAEYSIDELILTDSKERALEILSHMIERAVMYIECIEDNNYIDKDLTSLRSLVYQILRNRIFLKQMINLGTGY